MHGSLKTGEPNRERFPNGITSIIASAKQKNIQLGLWFHPSNENEYETWKTDADILINLYKTHGIRYFKIDGVKIETKKAEINFTKFLEEVKRDSNNEVFFNLDVTANVRGGYFMFRNAGNLFLENRYTDAGVYYPSHTLRNLWMLSKYFPPELLQIEFLNKWRNVDKYLRADIFAPSKYTFDYIFATTMMAQPLAWLEASHLPAEAMAIAPNIKKYKSVMADIHAGIILPIGAMPNGRSWTGFQSIKEGSGYFLVFRENTVNAKQTLAAYLRKGSNVTFTSVMNSGRKGSWKITANREVEVVLPDINSYVLYKYVVR